MLNYITDNRILISGIALLCIPHIVVALFFPHFIGVDHGSALVTRNWVIGEDYTHFLPFHYRPPLIGAVVLPFTHMFGDTGGGQAMVILSLVVMGLGSYFLARLWLDKHIAIVCAFASMIAPTTIVNSWSWHNSFLALGLSLFLIRLVFNPTKASWIIAPILMFIIGGLNQTQFVAVSIIILVIPGWNKKRFALLLLGSLTTMPWWPFLYKSVTMASTGGLGLHPLNTIDTIFNGWLFLGPIAYCIAIVSLRYYSPVRLALILTIVLIPISFIDSGTMWNLGTRMTCWTATFLIIHVAYVFRSDAFFRVITLKTKAIMGLTCSIIAISVFLFAIVYSHFSPETNMFPRESTRNAVDWIDRNSSVEDVILSSTSDTMWKWSISSRMSLPIDSTGTFMDEEGHQDSQCVIGEIECSDDDSSRFDYVIWSEPLSHSQLIKVYENIDWYIYEVHRPEINRSPVLGRAWPWSPELKWE